MFVAAVVVFGGREEGGGGRGRGEGGGNTITQLVDYSYDREWGTSQALVHDRAFYIHIWW